MERRARLAMSGWSRRSDWRAGALWTVLAASAGQARAQAPGDAAARPSDAAPSPQAASGYVSPSAPSAEAAPQQTQAEAALRAAQELEARLIDLRREVDGLERQRASWEDIRRRLDEIDARTQPLAGGQAAREPAAGGAPAMLQFRRPGLAVRSPDGAFLLVPAARLQALYEGDVATRGPLDASAPNASGFALAHAEIMISGHAVSPRLEYRLQVDFAQPLLVKDAFVQWRVTRGLGVRAGQFKVPYGLQRQYWTGYLEFVNFSQPTAAFSLERDVGVMVVGRPLGGRLHYQLAVLNGAGQGRTNDNLDLAYAVRVTAAPFGQLPVTEGDVDGQPRPLLSVGVAGYYSRVPTDVRARTNNPAASLDLDGDGRADQVAVWQGDVEVRAVFRGAALQGEWFGRIEQPGTQAGTTASGGSPADRRYWGVYGQASYFVLPRRLELAVRAGRTDLPLYGAALADRQARGTAVDEQSGAVSAYLRGHEAKLQVDYTHLRARDAGSAPETHRVRAAVQLAF